MKQGEKKREKKGNKQNIEYDYQIKEINRRINYYQTPAKFFFVLVVYRKRSLTGNTNYFILKKQGEKKRDYADKGNKYNNKPLGSFNVLSFSVSISKSVVLKSLIGYYHLKTE